MSAIGPTLFGLVRDNIHKNMKAINGRGPLELLRDQSYYLEMCNAIGQGIAEGSPIIQFVTEDLGLTGIPPVPALVGQGIGVIVDQEYMTRRIYTLVRNKIIEHYGRSTHPPYDPPPHTSGQYLKAIALGIAESVTSHFAKAYILTSAHPFVYQGVGTISDGFYSGLSVDTIHSLILKYSPRFRGYFWPIMARAIAEGYVDGIHNKSTGTVTIIGTCTPILVPVPTQLCAVPGAGVGSGVAA